MVLTEVNERQSCASIHPPIHTAMTKSFLLTGLLALSFASAVVAKSPEAVAREAYLANFQPAKAPKQSGPYLKAGDRLAIIGDSITEQKMYSRILETYLTVCTPELKITARQYGWGGERVPGFLARMTNDCLRFKPTVATTCYGMNDHEYRKYEDRIGNTYSNKSLTMVQSFKANGVRLVLGSPGCVGRMPTWVKGTNGVVDDLNINLCTLRNIDVALAQKEGVRFADVFWPMLTAGYDAQQRYGSDYAIAGKDGVHPAWAGQTVMAYAFLKGLGVSGDLGTFTVDAKADKMKVSKGHELIGGKNGEFLIKSMRYPFCATNENLKSDNSIRSAMGLIPFNEDLNRFLLVVKRPQAKSYAVTWGESSKTFTSEQLGKGVNLAAEFAINPFWDAFNKVDSAVKAKQDYETKQIKQIFHDLRSSKYKSAEDVKDPEMKELFALRGADGKLDMEALAAATERKRAPLAEAIQTAFVPVTHTLRIVAQ